MIYCDSILIKDVIVCASFYIIVLVNYTVGEEVIIILNVLISGLSQPKYYTWSIITNLLNTLIVGFVIGVFGLILRMTIIHRDKNSNKESNTYRLVSTISNLLDSLHNYLVPRNIRHYESRLINASEARMRDNHLYAHLPKDLINALHKQAIYVLMKPIYKALSASAFFIQTHDINWDEFVTMSKHNYCLIFNKFPKTRKHYLKLHPSFKICYNLYRDMKEGN